MTSKNIWAKAAFEQKIFGNPFCSKNSNSEHAIAAGTRMLETFSKQESSLLSIATQTYPDQTTLIKPGCVERAPLSVGETVKSRLCLVRRSFSALQFFFNLHFCDNGGDSQLIPRQDPARLRRFSWLRCCLESIREMLNTGRRRLGRLSKAQKENFWCANLITALWSLYVSAAWNTTVRKNPAHGSWTDHSPIGYTHLSTHTDAADLLRGGNVIS